MSKSNRQSAATAMILAAATQPVAEPTPVAAPKSIRQLIMTGITAGRSTKEIAAEVQLHFPHSAAAAKSVKHIAWYRSRMKKDAATAVAAQALLQTVDNTTAE